MRTRQRLNHPKPRMQCGLPLQHRRVSAWSRYHGGTRPLLPVCCTQATAVTGVMGLAVSWSVSHQWTALLVLPALGNVDSWFLPASCDFGTGRFIRSHGLRVPLPYHPPPPHTHCFSAATVPSSEHLILCLWAFSAQERSADPWGLVFMAPAPFFHLGRNPRPLFSQLLTEAVASLLELTLPFDFLLLLLMS